MAALKYIREARDSHLLLLGVVEEGESACYTVNADTYQAIGCPKAPTVLNDEQLSRVKYTDRLMRARKKALSLLAFSDNNRRTLGAKLARAGFDREIIEQTVEDMVELGYINENRQLERIILNEANIKLRGPAKILPFLVSKGYSSDDARRVMSRLVDDGEIDFKENARSLIQKKLPDCTDEGEIKKLLYKNGYKND